MLVSRRKNNVFKLPMLKENMIEYLMRKPTLDEFHELRNAVDWNLPSKGISSERAQISLDASPLCVIALDQGKIIGMVRLSGDLGMYGYIQDTIILPGFQGKGVGTKMMNMIMERVNGLTGYMLGVCPSKVSVSFYEKFGFKQRPQDPNGFMSIEVSR